MKRPKWPRNIRKHAIPIYGGFLVVCRNRDDYARCAASKGESEKNIAWAKDSTGCTQEFDVLVGRKQPLYLVGWFNRDGGTLAHELVHVAFMILRRSGIPLTKNNDEVVCYLVEELHDLATA